MIPVCSRVQLEAVMRPADIIRVVEEGFASYSRGETIIPAPAHLGFTGPEGECHIKYGYRASDRTFTVKIATGFPGNAGRGLSTSNGVILVLSSQTGELLAILQDEGFLTDIRTAAAGAIAAKLLAPSNVEWIGIIGAGVQARLQLEYLRDIVPTRKVMLWARSRERAEAYQVDGFEIHVANSCAEVAEHCRLIVTTTSSRRWLLGASDIRPGTHITAMGADGGGKQELAPELFLAAEIRAVDSRSQCAQFGDSAYAVNKGFIKSEDLVELGDILIGKSTGRKDGSQITIADLTGVAIQDIQVANLALGALGIRIGRD